MKECKYCFTEAEDLKKAEHYCGDCNDEITYWQCINGGTCRNCTYLLDK